MVVSIAILYRHYLINEVNMYSIDVGLAAQVFAFLYLVTEVFVVGISLYIGSRIMRGIYMMWADHEASKLKAIQLEAKRQERIKLIDSIYSR